MTTVWKLMSLDGARVASHYLGPTPVSMADVVVGPAISEDWWTFDLTDHA